MKFSAILIIFLTLCISIKVDARQLGNSESLKIGFTDKTGSVLGLNFISPGEDGWELVKADEISIDLKKKSEKSDFENSEIEAFLINLDVPASPISDFIEQIKNNIQEGYINNKMITINELEVTEYSRNSQCAKIHFLLEEVQPVLVNNIEQTKQKDVYSLACGLLKSKGLGFEVIYYSRHYKSNQDDQLASKVNKVLDSVIIQEK